MFNPRLHQAEVLEYGGGWMGVSAVPGSGKTHTLSALAARLILEGQLQSDQEVLIVTLVNSAVDNFSSRIAGFVKASGLLENVGYRVRTLHGLAHDIVRESPDIAGVSDQFSIIDDGESTKMIDEITAAYLREHPELTEVYITSSADDSSSSRLGAQWNSLLNSINSSFISQAKDLQAEPGDIRKALEKRKFHDPLIEMGIEVYTQYQRGLHFRNAVDFTDLIRMAYTVLRSDPQYLERLRFRWPYVLEDEAQDSSYLQEQILRLLIGPSGNWVRVGDPNQAIYETFTTANPKYLKEFLDTPGVIRRELPNSGRSNLSIINLANQLIRWTESGHPVETLRKSLTSPYIEPAPPGDPQPNPPDSPNAIYVHKNKLKPDRELEVVINSLKSWLPGNTDKSVAVLVPIAKRGERVVEELDGAGIKVVEMLKSSQSTRKTAKMIQKLLLSLADPSSPPKCSNAFQEIYQSPQHNVEDNERVERLAMLLRKTLKLEDFFYPFSGRSLTALFDASDLDESDIALLDDFRKKMVRWQAASSLPIDQLVLTLAQDLFTTPADLALTHKFALLLEFSAANHPEYKLVDFADELREIASNERRFIGFSEEETGIDPAKHKGEVFVLTYHKAKGLEWDRVYLLSVNNYDFPSAVEGDEYLSEKWFVKDHANLEAETLAKLKAVVGEDIPALHTSTNDATLQAREDYAAERLRLFYVGITRARENLIITWNSGKRDACTMSLPLQAMLAWMENNNAPD